MGNACDVFPARTYDSELALTDMGMANERIVGVSRNGFLSAALPTAPSNNCQDVAVTAPSSGHRYSIVANDIDVYLGNDFNATLTQVPWLAATSAWGSTSTNSPNLFTDGLVLFGSTLGGGGGGGLTTGGVFAMDAGNTDFTMPAPASLIRAGQSSEASGPIVVGTAAAPVFIYGNGTDLVRAPLTPGNPGTFGSATTATPVGAASFSTTGVAGRDGTIYVVDASGNVMAYSADLQHLLWSLTATAPGIAGGAIDSAPNADVHRNAGAKDCTRPGTLYVPSTGDGSLYAFVIDSMGIDSSAPWPRQQHDPQNTGNPATDLTPYSCP